MEIAGVANILASRGYLSESWYLSLTSKKFNERQRKDYCTRYARQCFDLSGSILSTLQNIESKEEWKRRCLQTELRDPVQFTCFLFPRLSSYTNISSSSSSSDVISISQTYQKQLCFKLKQAEEQMKKEDSKNIIVYQYVESCIFEGRDETRKKFEKKIVEGRILSRRFIAFPNAGAGFLFQRMWMQVQKNTFLNHKKEKTTMLLECGRNEDGILKKWVLDIDAPMEELRRDPESLLMSTDLDEGVKQLGVWICNILKSKFKIVRGQCFFSIVTRHTEKKRSWHMTLNMLADHSSWRHILNKLNDHVRMMYRETDQKQSIETQLFQFIDPCTLNNSKCQYMQVMYSTKIVENPKEEYSSFFKWYGMFNADGDRIESADASEEIQIIVTSMMYHDPWSSPLKKIACLASIAETGLQKAVKASKTEKVANEKAHLEKRQTLLGIEWPKQWMKDFFVTSASQITTIPAMSLAKNIPDMIQRQLLLQQRCRITTHVYIINARLCPRHFARTKTIMCHGTNHKCVVICTEEFHHRTPGISDFRMFGLCLSDKCKDKTKKNCKWVEIQETDYMTMIGLL